MSNMPNTIPSNVVEAIVQFIEDNQSIFKKVKNRNSIGKEIFNIVEDNCLIVYYPIIDANEKNDGFLLQDMPLGNGKCIDIIYINTFQTEEKQVFAAAHELGHYLKVAKEVNEKCATNIDEEIIVNRFAAELLMPKECFREKFLRGIKKKNKNNEVSMKEFLENIVDLMDFFSVPYNAVAIRLVETGIISREDGIMLVDGNEHILIEDISMSVDRIISNGNYKNLRTSSRKKEIKDLEAILDEAEKKGTVSKTKIHRLREKFGIVNKADNLFGNMIMVAEE